MIDKRVKYLQIFCILELEHKHGDVHDHIHKHVEGFWSEEDIEKRFGVSGAGLKEEKNPAKVWFKANDHHPFTINHNDQIGTSNFSCDRLTDEWFRWFLTTPIPDNAMTNPANPYALNAALMDKEGAQVYFAAGSPFQDPFDFKRIVITKEVPLLVPAYNVVASEQEYPFIVSSSNDPAEALTDIVIKDMEGIDGKTVEASLDGERFYGCTVVRNKLLTIANMPVNNVLGIPQDRLQESGSTIKCVHAGLWMLISGKKLDAGDHLLQFKVHSRNYQIQAKFLIKVLY